MRPRLSNSSSEGARLQKNLGRLPTARHIGEFAAHAFVNSSTGHPIAIGVLLCGPGTRLLRSAVDDLLPWLDDEESSAFHLIVLGNPKQCSVKFREFAQSLELRHDHLYAEWVALQELYGSEAIIDAFETHAAAFQFGLSEGDLPVLLILTKANIGRPIKLHIPREVLNDSKAVMAAVTLLRGAFSRTELERVERDADSNSRSLRHLMEARAHELECQLTEIEGGFRREPRSETPCVHAEDFSWVRVIGGATYHFKKGNQAETVRVLFEESEKAQFAEGCGLGEKAIAEKIGASMDSFAIRNLFRGHPAFKTLLQRSGKGLWALSFKADSSQSH